MLQFLIMQQFLQWRNSFVFLARKLLLWIFLNFKGLFQSLLMVFFFSVAPGQMKHCFYQNETAHYIFTLLEYVLT